MTSQGPSTMESNGFADCQPMHWATLAKALVNEGGSRTVGPWGHGNSPAHEKKMFSTSIAVTAVSLGPPIPGLVQAVTSDTTCRWGERVENADFRVDPTVISRVVPAKVRSILFEEMLAMGRDIPQPCRGRGPC